jgi:hypothetical protein
MSIKKNLHVVACTYTQQEELIKTTKDVGCITLLSKQAG